MSEKRFEEGVEYGEGNFYIWDSLTQEEIWLDEEVFPILKLLNNLAEENEQLRKRVERLQSILHIVECCDKDEWE